MLCEVLRHLRGPKCYVWTQVTMQATLFTGTTLVSGSMHLSGWWHTTAGSLLTSKYDTECFALSNSVTCPGGNPV